ncbi:CaiB/BaiF CoA-transferase family protein [Sphingobium sp.]|uniref:CaiB/BaiF CoA transferase family protein n=1 Tax=Sphingobium sp. TaxID=1912891 RepID=UPI0028BDA0DF|nr:CaiB/BaiF CoA-transferase family protein [Sphingobium sp.]
MSENDAVAGPLAGIRVLEVTQYISGPFAGQQLADMGAEVIKVERPDAGDPMRNYASGKAPLYGPNFTAINRNKRSVTLDLQSPDGIAAFKALADRADVVLENFRPDVMDRLGIGFEALRKTNPGLVYCSIAGFASDGPYARRPAFDTIGQALSGLLYLFTDPDKPSLRGPTLSDQVTGLYAANAIQSALIGRFRTGVGRRVDVSMLDATMSFIPDAFACYTESNLEWDSEFRAAMSHSLVLSCANDELIAVHMAGPEHMWVRFAEAIGRPDFVDDLRFKPRAVRIDHWDELIEELRPIFAAHSRAEWVERLVAADVPAAEVLRIPEVLENEGVRHAQMFETVDHPVAGPVTMMRRAARFDGERGPQQQPPALLGEHTEQVLAEIGFVAA